MAITDVLNSLLATVQPALTEPVGRAHLASGLPAWDDCCDGQLWVRLVSQVAAGTNQQTTQSLPCWPASWVLTVGVGVLRCAATIQDGAVLPTPAALTAEALAVQAEANAVLCAVKDWQGANRVAPVRWDPLGPDGGCVGGEWTITMVVL